MYISAAVVVIAIIVIGVGAYVYLGMGGGTTEGNGVADATSLQYDADVTSQGVTATYEFAGKNLGASDMMLRIDILGGESGNYTYILNAADMTAWTAVNGEWTDISSTYQEQWDSWNGQWTGNVDALAAWSGTGDYTYTDDNGDSVKIYNISVNPTLADSLFQPTT
jgi:hypothetical protein